MTEIRDMIVMENKKLKVGDIIVINTGYSMVIYDFYKVSRISDASIWLKPLTKRVVGDLNAPYYGRPVVKPAGESDMPEIRKSLKSYIGSVWNGDSMIEDHMD